VQSPNRAALKSSHVSPVRSAHRRFAGVRLDFPRLIALQGRCVGRRPSQCANSRRLARVFPASGDQERRVLGGSPPGWPYADAQRPQPVSETACVQAPASSACRISMSGGVWPYNRLEREAAWRVDPAILAAPAALAAASRPGPCLDLANSGDRPERKDELRLDQRTRRRGGFRADHPCPHGG